jgi:hypothetical protein
MEVDFTRPTLPPNQIFLFSNVVSDNVCDMIIKHLNDPNVELREEKYAPGQNVQCKFNHISDIKDYYLRKTLDLEIFNSIGEICNELWSKYKIKCTNDSGYQLRKITGPTRLHSDATVSEMCKYKNKNLPVPNNEIRIMSVIMALNSDYEGGEFCFPEHNTMVKLKKGQAIAFPPYWTHPHYTNDLNGTFRYTINTWLCE